MTVHRRRNANQRLTLAASHDGQDLYGRLTIPGMRSSVTARRARKATTFDGHFVHRAKNGVYDPLTYYHIVDTLLRLDAGQEFRTSELLQHLKATKPQLVWDATVVGRVMTDIAESLHESYGWTPVGYVKRWNGMTYDVLSGTEPRTALLRLLEDLVLLCEETIETEISGVVSKRIDSPLIHCPSIVSGVPRAATT